MIKPAPIASITVKGVRYENTTAKIVVVMTAPLNPSTVLFGLTFGMIYVFQISFQKRIVKYH